VLLVEDESTIRHLVNEVLAEHGYTVIGATEVSGSQDVLK
jgi:DNA-binding response OmpR family regulator